MATYEPERTRNFYLLGDSQAEMVQLIKTDQLFTKAMGGLLPEQPEQAIAHLHDVLDIACGPGGWCSKWPTPIRTCTRQASTSVKG
jgi:hypothetical protein